MDNSMTSQHDLLAHVEDDLAIGAFEMANLLTLLAFGGETHECITCGTWEPREAMATMPCFFDPKTGEATEYVWLCEACMVPVREEYAREQASNDGSSDDPLDEGFHGSS